ncbi:restriction endonuclease subunit S, partial [Pseudorhodoplanes sp.]|uniref:restriction endonuclease subunit S n=1 Tax=Pseudorhodoplanes sp. TaxID=1934341 RepID=UPI003D0BB6EA
IWAKRKLIALLNEQKQAIIHRAVTRGLDPNVRLKPSGVPLLGDVPDDWDLLPLKRVAKIQTGITLGKRYESQTLQDRPYLRVANVQTGRVDLSVVKTVAVPMLEAVGAELMAGDVLMTEGGDIDKLGRGCVWRGEIEHCLHQNHVFAVRPKATRMIPDYLVLLMVSRHGRFYFETTAKRTTNLASTNSTTIGAFPLALPPIVEQQEILTIVKQNTTALDVATEHIQQEIALLWDYRIRIAFALVSGRVDIRDAIAMLPDEAYDEAPGDDVAVDDNRPMDDEDSDNAAHEEIEA